MDVFHGTSSIPLHIEGTAQPGIGFARSSADSGLLRCARGPMFRLSSADALPRQPAAERDARSRLCLARSTVVSDPSHPPVIDPPELDEASSGLRSVAKRVVGSREEARAAWEALKAAAKAEGDEQPIDEEDSRLRRTKEDAAS
jgi:hypothetical protein